MRSHLYLHCLHRSFGQPACVVVFSVPHLHAKGLIMLGGHFGLVVFGGAVFPPSAMPEGRAWLVDTIEGNDDTATGKSHICVHGPRVVDIDLSFCTPLRPRSTLAPCMSSRTLCNRVFRTCLLDRRTEEASCHKQRKQAYRGTCATLCVWPKLIFCCLHAHAGRTSTRQR